jgi:hypothetical protein
MGQTNLPKTPCPVFLGRIEEDALPQLTKEGLDQSFAALEVANAIRLTRAEDKRRIKAERLDAASVLRTMPDHWRTAKVIDLLLAMPRVGSQRANRWLRLESISPTRPIAELSDRQRRQLARQIDQASVRRDNLRRQLEGRQAA